MNRTLNVVRMQLVNRMTFVWLPLIILGGSFVLTYLIYVLIPYDGPKYGGGAQAPLWYFLAVGIQALTLSFPFSQAMSVTRREFHLGTLLTAGLTAAVLSTVFMLGGFVETATNGWGRNGYFFRIPWLTDGPWYITWLVFFGIAMFFFAMGYWAAGIWKRWGALGLTIALLGLGLVLIGIMWLIGLGDAWIAVFTWIGSAGPVVLAGGLLALFVLLSIASYGTLRRTTP